jgi:hypothetical protein
MRCLLVYFARVFLLLMIQIVRQRKKDGSFVPVEKREEADATTWVADATVREVKTDKFHRRGRPHLGPAAAVRVCTESN